jgi:hypothetical protein
MRQESWKVTEDQLNEEKTGCCYCKQELGEEHEEDCVRRKKTVLVKVEFELPMVVPEFWDVSQIEFFLNDGSFCCSNLIKDMDKLFNQPDQEVDGQKIPCGTCLCYSAFEAEFVREMEEEDENHWNFRLETDGVDIAETPSKDMN